MSIDLNLKELAVIRAVRNSIIHDGKAPSIRKLMKDLEYKSTFSIVLLLNRLIETGYLSKGPDNKLRLLKDISDSNLHTRTINLPLVGSVSCGTPLLAEENIESYIPVSTNIAKPPFKYFLLRASGDSMNNKNIDDGDLLIIKQQNSARIGESVVALVDGESTVKELNRSGEYIILRPKSKNKKHKPIIVSDDFMIQGIVIGTIKDF